MSAKMTHLLLGRRLFRPTLLLLLVALLMLAACFGGRDEPTTVFGSEGTLSGTANLTCSDECRQRSQCGTFGRRWVILSSSAGPATEFHDLYFAADSEVTINQQQMAQVQGISGPSTPWRVAFYEIDAPGQGSGWVAGWCISQEIVP